MNLGSQFQAKDEGHARWQDGQRMAGLSSISPEFSRTARKNSNGTIYKLLVAFIFCFIFVLLACSPSHAVSNYQNPDPPDGVGKLSDSYIKLCKGQVDKIGIKKDVKGIFSDVVLENKKVAKKIVNVKKIGNKCIKITAIKVGTATISYKVGASQHKVNVEVVDCTTSREIKMCKNGELRWNLKNWIKVHSSCKNENKDIAKCKVNITPAIKHKKATKEVTITAGNTKGNTKLTIKTRMDKGSTKKGWIKHEVNVSVEDCGIEVYVGKMKELKLLEEGFNKWIEDGGWEYFSVSPKGLKITGKKLEVTGKKAGKGKIMCMKRDETWQWWQINNPYIVTVKEPKKVGVLVAPARSAQITFSAIEAGESVEILPVRLTGKRTTITFVATADGAPIKGPKTELTKTKTGGTAIVFLGGLSAAVTALLRDTEGNQVSISTVPGKSLPAPEELQPTFEGPVPVTDGSMDATVSVPSGKEIVDAAITDEEAKSATVEVVAHKRSESGIIEETAVTASGIPSEACADGSLGFELVTEDNRTIETQMDAFYIGYSMQRIAHVGQTASVKAKITGLGDDQVLSFTFVPDVARHGISPLTNQLTVGEINSGIPITSVTSKMIGEHAFDIVVKVAPPSEERLVP